MTTTDHDTTADTGEGVEPEPDVVYQLLAFRFGVGEADFDKQDGSGVVTEPVVLFDTVLGHPEGNVNARIILAGATSAIVADEAESAAGMLLSFILSKAEQATTTNDTADEAEKGEPA